MRRRLANQKSHADEEQQITRSPFVLSIARNRIVESRTSLTDAMKRRAPLRRETPRSPLIPRDQPLLLLRDKVKNVQPSPTMIGGTRTFSMELRINKRW